MRGVTVRMADSMLIGMASIFGVDADLHLLEGQHHDWIDWIHPTTKKKTHHSISQYWKWLCQVHSVLAKQPMECFILVTHSLCPIAVKLLYISGIKLMSTSYSALLVIFDMIIELAVVPCFLPMTGT